MGVERFEDGAEEPAESAGADLPKDTGSPGEADRSGDVPQSSEAGRPEEPTPENMSPESREDADVAEERAESRTRSEYADHIAPPDTPPIEGDSPEGNAGEPSHREDEHPDATPGQREPSGGSSAEQRQVEGRPELANDLERSDERSLSADDPPADPVRPEGSGNGKPDNEHLRAPEPSTEPGSEIDASGADHTPEVDYGRLSDAQHNEGESKGNDSNPELPEVTTDGRHTPDHSPDDRPHPLTNKEWAEHLDEVRDGLDNARGAGLRTIQTHTIDRKGQIWSEERSLLHDSLIDDAYAKAADVPCDFKAIVAGGLGGAGKTTVLREHAGIDTTQYLMINPDDFKEEMARRGILPEIEGLSPMEASDLAHEESSYLAKRLARRSEAEGKNLIWDITMASQDSTEDRIRKLHEAGYARVDGVFVDIPIEISVKRTESRHREGHENFRSGVGFGGRFVPPEVIRSQGDAEWSSQNRRTYEAMKGHFSSWSIYDNSVEDRPAKLIESSNRRHES